MWIIKLKQLCHRNWFSIIFDHLIFLLGRSVLFYSIIFLITALTTLTPSKQDLSHGQYVSSTDSQPHTIHEMDNTSILSWPTLNLEEDTFVTIAPWRRVNLPSGTSWSCIWVGIGGNKSWIITRGRTCLISAHDPPQIFRPNKIRTS